MIRRWPTLDATACLMLAWLTILVFLLVGWLLWAIAGLYSPKLMQSRLNFVLLPGWGSQPPPGSPGSSA